MANLFSKAKKVAPKTKAKDEKVRINIDDASFFDNIEKLQKLNDEIKSAEAKFSMISSEIKELGKSEWSKLYDKKGKNPGSVMLQKLDGLDIAQVMFIPTDKYITINEARADELREQYDEDIVTEEVSYSFDSEMIEKYGEVLSNLIMNSDDISEDDKESIIKATTKFSVTKGTIDRFTDYGEVVEIMENVRPVISLKNIEVIRG